LQGDIVKKDIQILLITTIQQIGQYLVQGVAGSFKAAFSSYVVSNIVSMLNRKFESVLGKMYYRLTEKAYDSRTVK